MNKTILIILVTVLTVKANMPEVNRISKTQAGIIKVITNK